MTSHQKLIAYACSGLLAVLLSGCGSVVSWEQTADVEALAKTWPKYKAPHYIDPLDALPIVDRTSASVTAANPAGNADPAHTLQRLGSRLDNAIKNRNIVPPIKPRDEWDTSEIVADSLGRIGAAAVPPVVKQLSDPDPKIRIQAARILAKIGPDASSSVTDLTKLLNDDNSEVRKAAARALGQIGPAAENSVEALLDMMSK